VAKSCQEPHLLCQEPHPSCQEPHPPAPRAAPANDGSILPHIHSYQANYYLACQFFLLFSRLELILALLGCLFICVIFYGSRTPTQSLPEDQTFEIKSRRYHPSVGYKPRRFPEVAVTVLRIILGDMGTCRANFSCHSCQCLDSIFPGPGGPSCRWGEEKAHET
jgi:hypothetical protein